MIYPDILLVADKGVQVIFYIKAPRVIEIKDCTIYKSVSMMLDKKMVPGPGK